MKRFTACMLAASLLWVLIVPAEPERTYAAAGAAWPIGKEPIRNSGGAQSVSQKLGEVGSASSVARNVYGEAGSQGQMKDSRQAAGRSATVTEAVYPQPEPPVLFPVPGLTNGRTIEVAGTAELNAVVRVYYAALGGWYDEVGQTVASEVYGPNTGKFQMTVPLLWDLENRITAVAEVNGEYSDDAEPLRFEVDWTPPASVWDFTWKRIGFDAVELHWEPPQIPDPNVPNGYIPDPTWDHYVLEKDGSDILTTKERTYYEDGLGEMAKIWYAVYAVDKAGNRSEGTGIWVSTFHRSAVLVAQSLEGSEYGEQFFQPLISEDGSTVAYIGYYQDEAGSGPDPDSGYRVYAFDRESSKTELIGDTVDSPYSLDDGPLLDMSPDGRYVLFNERIELARGEEAYRLVVYDRETKTKDELPYEFHSFPLYLSMSDDTKWITFSSTDDDIVPNDRNEYSDVFLYNRTDPVKEIKRISVSAEGTEGNDSSVFSSLSGDGRYAMFTSISTNLTPGIPSGDKWRLFTYDTSTGVLKHEPVLDTNGNELYVWDATMSQDSRYVTFTSAYGYEDRRLYLMDRQTGQSHSMITFPRNEDIGISNPRISADGRFISFDYYNYDPSSRPGPLEMFDSQWGVMRFEIATGQLTRAGERAGTTYDASISGDGSMMAFTTARSAIYAVCLDGAEACELEPQQEEDGISAAGWSPDRQVRGMPVIGGSLTIRAYSLADKPLEAVIDYLAAAGGGLETKRLTVPMTLSGEVPRLYTASVPVMGDAVQVSAIQVRVKSNPGAQVQLSALPKQVAGRVKLTVQTDYPQVLEGASAVFWSEAVQVGGSGKLSKQLDVAVDLAEAADYRLTIVDSAGRSLYEQQGVFVLSGKEGSIHAEVRPIAELKVKVEADRYPSSNETVEFYDSGDRLLFSGKTNGSGMVDLWGVHYAGETVKVKVPASPPYGEPTIAPIVLGPGLNETTVQLEKLTTGTVGGRVTDGTGAPVKGAKVVAVGMEKGLRVEGVTDEAGIYSFKADVGAYLVSAERLNERPYYKSAGTQYVRVTPGGSHGMNLFIGRLDTGTIVVDAKMKPVDGDWQPINIDDWRTAVHYGLSVKSAARGFSYASNAIDNRMAVKGQEGEVFEVCLDGQEAGLTAACGSVVLDEWLEGTAELRLEEKGRIGGRLIGESDPSPFVAVLYKKNGNGSKSLIRYIDMDRNGLFSSSVPDAGDYSLVVMNDVRSMGYYQYQSASWRSYTIDVTIAEGERMDVGPITLPSADSLFYGKPGNGINSRELNVMPGGAVTVRGSYKLEGAADVHEAKLAVSIPAGMSLLADSMMLNGSSVAAFQEGNQASVEIGRIDRNKEGTFSYRLAAGNDAAGDLPADVHVRYKRPGSDEVSDELLGTMTIRSGEVTLEAPERSATNSLRVSGRAPAGKQVTVYADEQLVGFAEATPGGVWYTRIELPAKPADAIWGETSRYRLTAQAGTEDMATRSPAVFVSVDPDHAIVGKFTMRQTDGRIVTVDTSQGVARFPYVIVPGMLMQVAAEFNAPDRADNVKVTIGEHEVAARWNETSQKFEAAFIPPYLLGAGVYVTYDEKPKDYRTRPVPTEGEWTAARDILPDIWRNAKYEIADDPGFESKAGSAAELDGDGYYHAKPMRVTFDSDGKEQLTLRWKIKPAPMPGGSGSGRPIPYSNYSMNEDEAAGKVTISATMPASLLSPEQRMGLLAQFGPKGIEDHVINTLELVFHNSDAFGKFATGMDLKDYVIDGLDLSKYADDLLAFQDYVINNECHAPTVKHYIEATDLLFEQASRNLIVKNTMTGLGLVAGTLSLAVPPVGGFVLATTFTVIGDIAKDSWETNLNELKAEFEKDKKWRDDMAAAGAIDRCKKKDDDDDDDKKKKRKDKDKVADPTWIWDPSGYVYETVPGNRLEGVTATLLQQDSNTGGWHVWDADWFGQMNPLVSDRNGRYGWDVPEGRWKVLFAKEGYQPAESAELVVLPPHLDVNIPMKSLQAPQVSVVEAVYGEGLQVGFTKYMLSDTVIGSSITVLTADGDSIAGTVQPIDQVQDTDRHNVAKRFRFVPDPSAEAGAGAFRQGASLKVKVAAQVLSYAHVPMEEEYIAASVVVQAADSAPPEAAADLQATGGSRQILVDWKRAADAEIAGYKLIWQPAGGGSVQEKELAADQAFAVIDGLARGAAYELKLVTVGRNHVESAGLKASARTDDEPELVVDTTAPGQVTGAGATAERKALTVAWTDPADADLRSVIVSVKAAGKEGDSASAVRYAGRGLQTARFDGLEPGTDYTVALVSADTYWNESAAVVLQARTLDADAPGSVISPSAVGGERSVEVSWTDPADADLKHVLVAWTRQGTGESFGNPATVGKGVQRYTIGGLPEGAAYDVKLTAVDESGNTSAPVIVSARTKEKDGKPRSGGGSGTGGGLPVQPGPAGQPGAEIVGVTAGAKEWSGFNGRISLGIPAETFEAGNTLTVYPVEESALEVPEANQRYSDAFGLEQATGTRALAKSVQLTMAYSANKHAGFDVRKLGLYRQNESDKSLWHYMGGVFDSATETISASIDRLGVYAVMDYSQPFADIAGHWAKRDTDVLISRHIVDGITQDRFAPEQPLTRAQFTKLLVGMLLGGEVPAAAGTASGAVPPFRDVPADAWHYAYITEAKRRGLVEGGVDGSFRPDDPLTREELAVLVGRALGLDAATAAGSPQPGFADGADIAGWAAPYVEAARAAGLIDGVDGDRFAPQGYATRAQGAVLIVRAMERLGLLGK
jgi:Tol biopolymer transport system component